LLNLQVNIVNVINVKHCARTLALLAAISVSSISGIASAQSHGGGHPGATSPGGGVHSGGTYRGGNRGAGVPRGGDGRRGGGWHRGGAGWWGVGLGLGLGWEAGYFGSPYYPYADFYYPYVPSTGIVESVPQPTAPVEQPSSPPATSNWYYCESAKAYYPYVRQCPEPWKIVPAVPPQTSATAP
jgi:hypothetical protein